MRTAQITIKATINKDLGTAWKSYTDPVHITQWNFASDDWHCPAASNDLRIGGRYIATMAAKDGSFSFDFDVVYDDVQEQKRLAYTMIDGRQVMTTFESMDDKTIVTTVFDPENENPIELQQDGWQAILNNFKKHTETL